MSHDDNCDCKDGTCECGDNCGGSCGCDCNCGCDCCGSFHRRYQTKAEQVKELESYLADLRLEVQAVEERISDFKK